MRAGVVVLVCVGLWAGCSGGEDQGGGDVPPKPGTCGLICGPEHEGCVGAPQPWNPDPEACIELCYWGGCCYLNDRNVWEMLISDCWVSEPDAGIDAGIDAAPEPDAGLETGSVLGAP